MIRIPWGKHEGSLITELPTSYLAWVISESSAKQSLKTACREELIKRLGVTNESKQESKPESKQETIKKPPASWVKDWYKRASLVAHPDRGGSAQLMKLVIEIKEKLEG